MQKKEPLLCAAQCLWTQDESPLSQTRPVMKNCIFKVFFVWVDRSIGIGIGRKAFPSPWYHLWTSFGSFELIVLTAVQEREAQSLGAGERIIQQFAIISMDNGYRNGKMTTLTGKRRSHCSSFTTLKEKGDLTFPRLPSTWLGPAARASALTWWWLI